MVTLVNIPIPCGSFGYVTYLTTGVTCHPTYNSFNGTTQDKRLIHGVPRGNRLGRKDVIDHASSIEKNKRSLEKKTRGSFFGENMLLEGVVG